MFQILKSIFTKRISKTNKAVTKNIANSTVNVTQINIDQVNNLIIPSKDISITSAAKDSLYSSGIPLLSDTTNELNSEIDKAVIFIKSNRIEDAKKELFRIFGKVEKDKDKYKKEIARIYNNLGVCFNRPKFIGGDFEEAAKYFTLSFEYDPHLKKALANLASVYLNIGGKENFKKAYETCTDLWQEKITNKGFILPVFLIAIYEHKSIQEAIKWFENDDTAKEICVKDEPSLTVIGGFYLESGDVGKVLELTKRGMEVFPTSAKIKHLKAKTLLLRAQKDKTIPSYFSFVPEFSDYQDIENAMMLLEEGLNLVKGIDDFLETLIKADMVLCSIWLHRANDAKYKAIKDSINLSILPEEQRHILKLSDVDINFSKRNFAAALLAIEHLPNWKDATYQEKRRVAHIFLLEGAVEEAEKILREIESVAEKEKDVEFWFDIGIADVLLDNKTLAIKEAEKAKDFAKGTHLEKKALSHFNALMMRYAGMGEVDRLMSGMFEYDKKYPEDKSLKQIKAIDEKGQLSNEIKEILLKQKERYEKIRKDFKEQTLPTYFLEKMFNKRYIEIISTGADNFDLDFTIDFMPTSQEEIRDLLTNFIEAESLIFDYAALLNLSKMDLLGILNKFGKGLCIVRSLFDKIQEELLYIEKEELRKLWNFIRKSSVIEIVSKIPEESTPFEKTSDYLGAWLIESIKLAKNRKAVFVSDDFRLLMYLKSESIKGTNNFALLQEMLKAKYIDKKIYALSLGDLAERTYIFISFSGDNLFDIVVEDKVKITFRSYHLINQVFLPHSDTKSFTSVFAKFLFLLWKTGSLPQEKNDWLTLLSETIKKLIDKNLDLKNLQVIKDLGNDFAIIWRIAISESNKDELILLEKTVDKVFDKPYFTKLLPSVKDAIKKRISEL